MRTMFAAASAVALSAGLAVSAAAPSQAAGGACYTAVTPRVYVDSSTEWVRAVFSDSCKTYNARALWYAVDPGGVKRDHWIYDSDGSGARRSASITDGSRLGRWKSSAGGAINQATGARLEQNYDYTLIRLRSLLSISGTAYDPGDKVVIRGRAKRYSPAANTYRAWSGVKVKLYVRKSSSSPWVLRSSKNADRYGRVSFTTYAPYGYDFHLRTSSTSNTWGKYSNWISEN